MQLLLRLLYSVSHSSSQRQIKDWARFGWEYQLKGALKCYWEYEVEETEFETTLLRENVVSG